MRPSDLERGFEDMGWDVYENGAGLEIPSGTAAAFVPEEGRLDPEIDALEARLEEKGYVVMWGKPRLEHHPDEDDDSWRSVLVFRTEGGMEKFKLRLWDHHVCVFHREDPLSLGQLAEVTRAIERACNVTLVYDGGDDGGD